MPLASLAVLNKYRPHMEWKTSCKKKDLLYLDPNILLNAITYDYVRCWKWEQLTNMFQQAAAYNIIRKTSESNTKVMATSGPQTIKSTF